MAQLMGRALRVRWREMIKGREENKGEGRQKGGSRRGEEAHGRGDLASIHPPTLLAAEAQTVCSQQYMHLLVLFQEIITLCVCVDIRMFACPSSPKSGRRVAMRWQMNNMEQQYEKCTKKKVFLDLWVCQT